MDIGLWILGLLRRFGPQHGYQIKKLIGEEVADFARMKLPTIYYHLQRMEAEGLLSSESEKDTNRPERRVFSITAAGDSAFVEALAALLEIEYEPSFACDALLYFADSLEESEVLASLEAHSLAMDGAVRAIESHEALALAHLPSRSGAWASAIFDHHKRHYGAEAEWARSALATLRSLGSA